MGKQNQSLKWRRLKVKNPNLDPNQQTFILVHSVNRSKQGEMPYINRNGQIVLREMLSATTEHGNRIHFPASMLQHKEPTHDEIAAAEQSIANRNIKKLKEKFSGKREWSPKPFNFVVLFDQK